MKNLVRSSLAALVLCMLGSAVMASKTQEAAALKVAQAWLAVVDSGKYDESWEGAAGYFKAVLPKTRWRRIMTGGRRPLGRVLSRKLRGKAYATELPGAPDGHYVVIQFTTSFENKRTAIETVTPMLGAQGKWRVAGYFIK